MWWSGWGFLSMIIAALTLFIGVANPFDPVRFLMATIIGAAVNWYIGKKFNSDKNKRIYTDEETGERVQLDYSHRIYSMKMEYFSIVIIIGHSLVLLNYFLKN